MTQRWRTGSLRRDVLRLLLVGGIAFVAGCGGAGDTTAPRATTSTTATTVSTTQADADAKPEDGTEFCEIFQGLSERKQSKGGGFERYADEAAWTAGVESVERIAASAPDAISSQAETYVQLVNDRMELAASYGYEPVPQSAKLEFGRAHAAMQQEANELIAFAKANCSGVV